MSVFVPLDPLEQSQDGHLHLLDLMLKPCVSCTKMTLRCLIIASWCRKNATKSSENYL